MKQKIKLLVADFVSKVKLAFKNKTNAIAITVSTIASIINLFGVFKVSALLITAYLVYIILDRSKEQ